VASCSVEYVESFLSNQPDNSLIEGMNVQMAEQETADEEVFVWEPRWASNRAPFGGQSSGINGQAQSKEWFTRGI
jgi:hypothetical protein